MIKLLSDIFSMSFDLVIPLSVCMAAVMMAALLFCIRYISYRKNKWKYEKQARKEADSAEALRDTVHTPGETLRG